MPRKLRQSRLAPESTAKLRPLVAGPLVDFRVTGSETARGRGPARFRQVDAERAIKVARKCGLAIAAVRPDGTVIVYDASAPHPFAHANQPPDDSIYDHPVA